MYDEFVAFVRSIYNTQEFIPLHAPKFIGNEKKYVQQTIDSTFVSTIGEYVSEFEKKVAEYTGSNYAIATMNGTAALHVTLRAMGIQRGDEVITQSMSFIATSNAINYCGAKPIFVDVEKSNLGLCPNSLQEFLQQHTYLSDKGECLNKHTGARIRACVPMHTFGHPVDMEKIARLCTEYKIQIIEDAAEALGSYYKDSHAGSYGIAGVLSFNGNKIITCGGGGMVLTDNEELASKIKHLTTTSKKYHSWDIEHDEIGYNYRMPNINAALGCAQIEKLSSFVNNKRKLAKRYENWFTKYDVQFVTEPEHSKSNYWLNSILFNSRDERNEFLKYSNANEIMTRPVWTPIHKLSMYENCQTSNLKNTHWLADRLVNIPSSVVFDGMNS